jgi:hypothetical protein
MAEERTKMEWEIASTQMAVLANCNRDPKKHATPFKPNEFNPLKRKKEEVIRDTKEGFRMMKALWCKKEKK